VNVGLSVVRIVVVGGRVGLAARVGSNHEQGQDNCLMVQFFKGLKSAKICE
jgi:hypothetical protein